MKIEVVGGAGRMGLPFALSLAKRGHEIWINDLPGNSAAIKIAEGKMPFEGEEEGQKILDECLGKNLFVYHYTRIPDRPHDGEFDFQVICFLITTLERFKIDTSPPNYRPKGNLLIRSTLPFGMGQELIDAGLDFAYIPERGIEGEMIEEFDKFPQIIGIWHTGGKKKVELLFQEINIETIFLSVTEAEMVKLMCNAWRYSVYALANSFWTICDKHRLDFNRIRSSCGFRYPRFDMPRSGLVGGPCLEKDASSLVPEHKLLECADAVNKTLPSILVHSLSRLCIEKGARIDTCTVGLLGEGFKAGVADTRNSKTEEVEKRLIGAGFRNTMRIDPHIYMRDFRDTFNDCDAYIVCTPHEEFRELDPGDKPYVDTWGVWS